MTHNVDNRYSPSMNWRITKAVLPSICILIAGVLTSACGANASASTPVSQATPTDPDSATATAASLEATRASQEGSSANATEAASEPEIIIPTATAYPNRPRFSIGQSVEGRELWLWQFGSGEITITLIGGIHGGFEGNTVVLGNMLVEHFRDNPEDILPNIRLVIIPNANPDGYENGVDLNARFNANGVDLNRNWGCDWQPTAFVRDIPVDPGPRPFSEPESFALRQYFLVDEPDVVLFYHSQLGEIFLGSCDGSPQAAWLGDLLEDATGYTYNPVFNYYPITGDATNWLAERGIPAATVELETRALPEFEVNLAGIFALQCYYAFNEPDVDLTDPQIDRLCD
ncbi:MAG: hypothetical protein GYB68_06375 [Chloroflexi bacterium]|nr:hypothetical protein [Chloroflexota bacterium]